jgi:hypothetical protein
LVERWTVEELSSIGHWFDSGSRDPFCRLDDFLFPRDCRFALPARSAQRSATIDVDDVHKLFSIYCSYRYKHENSNPLAYPSTCKPQF